MALALAVALAVLAPGATRGEIRFDVFLGHDNMVPSMGWFPVACEVVNDGPAFLATFELSTGFGAGQGDVRAFQVELPTGTLKRFVLPVHAPGIYMRNFHARLLDARGKVRAEALNLSVRNADSWNWQMPLSAAVGNWMPALPDVESRRYNSGDKPTVARLLPALFPDNPIALNGLATIYLASDRALDLKPPQARALVDWLHQGGHLVVSVKQTIDFNGAPWLQSLLPCTLSGMATSTNQSPIQEWLVSGVDARGLPLQLRQGNQVRPPQRRAGENRSQATPASADFENPFAAASSDRAFESAPMEIAVAALRDGRVMAGTADRPLIVVAPRGRGQITLMNFNPEMKPFLLWPNRHLFWAKMVGMSPELLVKDSNYSRAYQSLDGVFGAMVDSRQIRKLPIGWLLTILLAYLLVIGPIDRFWLKKINRPMLTWLTFPAYVALFSVLIYFIGYKLRAGETEWNEIHLVDVLPDHGGGLATTRLHGLTYGSLYSPANTRYPLAMEKPFAAFRGEYGTSDAGNSEILHKGDGFLARVRVPVWTSQLFASRWSREDAAPFTANVVRNGSNTVATVSNHLDVDLTDVRLVHEDRIRPLGLVPAGETKTFELDGATPVAASSLHSFVTSASSDFERAVNARRNPLGRNTWSQISNVTNAAMAACFLETVESRNYLTPPGLDLSSDLQRGHAVVLAWTANHAPVEPLNRFTPRRHHRDTLWRLVLPLPNPNAPAL